MGDVTPDDPRIRVKICGVTSEEDALHAAQAGAWAIGLNLWPGSPRHLGLDDAAPIAAALKRKAEVAGVFVNQPLGDIAEAADQLGLTLVQLHGDEGPAFCAEVARRTGARVIKAVRVRSGADVQALTPFHTDFHLVDAYVPGQRGGTGEAFDWRLLRQRRSRVPLILAGGLRPDNVAEAVRAVHPAALDVASGVESELGRKDPAKVEALIEAARAAAHEVHA
jgi:phosphoribosylanthranilate isomerase